MNIFEAIILGILQGITEFFPISSSGHLVLGKQFFGIHSEGFFYFNVFVHLATLLAVLIYFRKIIWEMVTGILKGDKMSIHLATALVIATIPAVVVAMTISDLIENTFSYASPVLTAMMITGGFFIVGELIAKKISHKNKPNLIAAFFIGLVQSVAIIPGVSRSGSTLIAGMLTGLDREKAAEFSFLMAIPAIAGAGLFATLDGLEAGFQIDWPVYLSGFISAAISGYFSIYLLMKLYKKHSLVWFAAYLIVLPVIALVLLSKADYVDYSVIAGL